MSLLTARTSGLVHVILFTCILRILPPCSMFPKFLISNPKVLSASTDVADGDFEGYSGDAVIKQPKHADAELKQIAHQTDYGVARPPSVISGMMPDPRDPFVDPVPSIDEAIIKRVHSPDSEYGSAYPSPHHRPRTLSPVAMDYVDRSLLAEQAMTSSPDSAPAQGEQGRPLEQGPVR